MKKLISSRNLKKHILGFKVIPTYTEDSLFLMSLSFVALLLIEKSLLLEIIDFTFGDFRTIIMMLIIATGIILSFYHAFSEKKKTESHKFAMIYFAVFVNAGAGIAASSHLLKTANILWGIFPILNFVNAMLLLFLFRIGKINEKSISDEQSKLWEITLGSIMVLIIIFISHYIYKNYWALTFSIAVSYATSLNESIKNLFFQKYKISISSP